MHCKDGKELSIDTTASRAILGGAYAMPGLHSKYFDKNLEPLVEVVQDTDWSTRYFWNSLH